MSEEEIKYGLAGVVTDTTAVSKVMPETNSLTYRGYAVQDLSAHCRFEEVAYLMLNGELPTQSQLDAFIAEEKSHRALSADLLSVIARFNKDAHPMDTLRTAVSFFGQEDPTVADSSPEGLYAKAVKMLAAIPTMVAADFRIRKGEQPIAPDASLGFSENFFNMCFGTVPAEEVVKCFDISLTLYAE
ncbi:MAG: citrate/2-methylcitrate synthase, partial [Pseudomonadota bacterium]